MKIQEEGEKIRKKEKCRVASHEKVWLVRGNDFEKLFSNV